MSASRERKKRMEQGQTTAAQKKTTRKLSSGWILAICVVLILAIVFGSILGYRAYQRNQPVMTVGEHVVRVPEFNYFYVNQVSTISTYASYIGMDLTTALDEQYVTESAASSLPIFGMDTSFLSNYTLTDGTYNITWAQAFALSARRTIAQAYVIYDAAMAAGFTLSDAERAEMEAEIDELKAAADTNGESPDGLIRRVYGAGCDLDGYRDYLELMHVAQLYPATITYDAERLDARYAESPEDFDTVCAYVYQVAASSFAETDEDGNRQDPTEENEAEAKAAAEDMEKKFDEDFSGEHGTVSLYADRTRASIETLCGEEAATWVFDTAKEGDVKLFEHDSTYYVLKLVFRGDYQTVNALEIYIPDDGETVAEGEKTAEEKRADIAATLEADSSESSYRGLIERYPSEGSDGVVTDMPRSTMSYYSKDIFTWGAVEERKPGDWKTFEVSGGTFTLYFTGYGSSYRDTVVTTTLTTEWVTAETDAAVAACGYDESAAMHGNVGLVLGSAG